MDDERKTSKSEVDVKHGFSEIFLRGGFTVSDLYQLRCAVVHAGSSSIEDKNKGSVYSPYRVIGVSTGSGVDKPIASYGHTAIGLGQLENCAYDCTVNLEGLISLMAQGVARFVKERPEMNRECSTKEGFNRLGIVDFRPLQNKQTGC